MQITDILKKEFQEVFPTIIGEEPKISFLDIMETSHDHIISEIQNLKEGANHEKNELVSLLKLVEISEMDIDYDSHIHYRFKRISERYPDYKSFRFFVYRYILSTAYDLEEYSLENFTRLIKRILDDDILINTDFISSSEFGNSLLLLNKVSDDLISILKDAISRYPQKIALLWITANLLRNQEKYQDSIRYYKLFLEKLDSIQNLDNNENIDLDYVDADAEQMVCFQIADIHFDIGDYTNALNYCNKVLDHDQDKENSSFYYDTLIIRIRIHMNSNDRPAFQQDYAELLKVISEEELKENYADLIDFQPSSDD